MQVSSLTSFLTFLTLKDYCVEDCWAWQLSYEDVAGVGLAVDNSEVCAALGSNGFIAILKL